MRLSNQDRTDIRYLYYNGVPAQIIAEKYGISVSRVIAVVRRD